MAYINYKNMYVFTFNYVCNLNCIYCCQKQTMRNKKIDVIEDENLQKVYQMIDNEIITDDIYDKDNRFVLSFFGGEPLLHWDKLKEIVLRCREVHNDKIMFRIITNASLLNQEKVDFINNNFIDISASWDGPHSDITRGYNVIKDKEEFLLQIHPPFSFSSVFTKYNLVSEYFNALKSFAEKYKNIHNEYPGVSFTAVRDMKVDYSNLFPDDYDAWVQDVKNTIAKQEPHIQHWVKFILHRLEKGKENRYQGCLRKMKFDNYQLINNGYTIDDDYGFSRCANCDCAPYCYFSEARKEEDNPLSWKYCEMMRKTFEPIISLYYEQHPNEQRPSQLINQSFDQQFIN